MTTASRTRCSATSRRRSGCPRTIRCERSGRWWTTSLRRLWSDFEKLYSHTGRPSIPPERLLRALLLQVLYSIRSERMLMEQLDYNLLFRWFVGLSMDDRIWDPTVFTKNRDRLLRGQIAVLFFEQVLAEARERGLTSDEHFTVDGTLVEAWASLKSFKRKDGSDGKTPPDDPGNPDRELPRGEAQQRHPPLDDGSGCAARDARAAARKPSCTSWATS